MKAESKKEKSTPKKCVCGGKAVPVTFRGKKMVSCPNPEKCQGNLRTRWHRSIDEAVLEWNGLVDSFKYAKSGK